LSANSPLYCIVFKPFASRRCRKEFFLLSVVNEWNSLPDSVVNACSLLLTHSWFMGDRRYEHYRQKLNNSS